jgi:hypothetical protein
MAQPGSPPPAQESVKQEPIDKMNTDPDTWEGMFNTFMLWVAKDPWTFLGYVAVVLAPLLLISACLSWKMAKTLEKQEKKPVLRRSPRKTAKAD